MGKKQWIAATGILALLACPTFSLLLVAVIRPGVTKMNFDRIEEGMTVNEVENLFGTTSAESVAAFDKAFGDDGYKLIKLWLKVPFERCDVWVANNQQSSAFVRFDRMGCVEAKYWCQIPPQTMIASIRQWLRLAG